MPKSKTSCTPAPRFYRSARGVKRSRREASESEVGNAARRGRRVRSARSAAAGRARRGGRRARGPAHGLLGDARRLALPRFLEELVVRLAVVGLRAREP